MVILQSLYVSVDCRRLRYRRALIGRHHLACSRMDHLCLGGQEMDHLPAVEALFRPLSIRLMVSSHLCMHGHKKTSV